MAACILIGVHARDELGYDAWHPDAERIYRVSKEYYSRNGSPEFFPATNSPQAVQLLQEDFAEVESSTRLLLSTNMLVRQGDLANYEDAFRYADSNVFDFFSFVWLQGDSTTALAEPGSVVLTSSTARRYFGDEDPMGKVLELGRLALPVQVTGIIDNLPGNSHLSADAFASLSTLINSMPPQSFQSWSNDSFYSYIKLKEGASLESVLEGMPAFINRHVGEGASAYMGQALMPLTDIHLYSSSLQFPLKETGSIRNVQAMLAIALCILVIACLNFMNMSTARSTQRGIEVGIRKAMGAGRSQLIVQFLGESLIASMLALLLAVILVELSLPTFNAFLGRQLELEPAEDFWLLLGLGCGSILAGIVAGAYPAFYLSAFRANSALRGGKQGHDEARWFRNVLVVLQFSASIVLLIATAVVYLQLEYAKTMDKGYSTDQILVLDNLDSRWPVLKERLEQYSDITALTVSNLVPGENNGNAMVFRNEGGGKEGRPVQILMVEYGFFDTWQVDFLAGRDFSPELSSDILQLSPDESMSTNGAFIVNASAANLFGWTPESALDNWLELSMGSNFQRSVRGNVIGVVRDINFETLDSPIEPVIHFLPSESFFGAAFPLTTASLKVKDSNLLQTIDFIEAAWVDVFPDRPINLGFADQNFEALYLKEKRLGILLAAFSFLAVSIASLGLIGLASFNAECRTKEIGIRKVMGSSVWQIVCLLTNDFSRLVLVSNLIAWPVAYFAMSRWLESFAYRIDLTPLIFIGSGLIALCIAWVTVGGTAAKAAAQKPVLALRYE